MKKGKGKGGAKRPQRGLPKATGGFPTSPLGKPSASAFRDPNSGMGGVHIHIHTGAKPKRRGRG